MNRLTDDFYLPVCPVLTDAIDKGDSRRLGKKPVFTSSQVILIFNSVLTFVLSFKVIFLFQKSSFYSLIRSLTVTFPMM